MSKEAINNIIDSYDRELQKEKEDEKIKPRTIIGSVAGIIVSSIVGGILWGASLIYTQRAMVLWGLALILLCYWTIRIFTKQSKKNIAVLISTIIAIVIAGGIGQILYQIFGNNSVDKT